MDDDLKTVTEWLLAASSEVGADFMHLPVAGRERAAYRERVYCYELYHRWRSSWDNTFQYSLAGEVDKSGHPLIRGNAKPDFLVHVPGMARNLLVVEVKPANAALGKMVKDLKTLTRFRRDLGGHNYHAAYLWIYGLDRSGWRRVREQLIRSVTGLDTVDLSSIKVVLHSAASQEAYFVEWN
ncbi:MAG TPA: hypothetical protein VLC46_05575 [Thermoanaerobaculia bacterium]|jgi:hypothetical protein|nr:hypothetical protein [Thermoanaerobaculia bacterium]